MQESLKDTRGNVTEEKDIRKNTFKHWDNMSLLISFFALTLIFAFFLEPVIVMFGKTMTILGVVTLGLTSILLRQLFMDYIEGSPERKITKEEINGLVELGFSEQDIKVAKKVWKRTGKI